MHWDWTYVVPIVALMLMLCTVKNSPAQDTGGMTIANTNAWRAVFALVVVLHHVAGIGILGTGLIVALLAPVSVGAWSVSGFFMISGYGLCLQTINKGTEVQRDKFLRRRLSKLLPLLVILMVAAMLYQDFFMHVSVAEQLHQFPKYNVILWYSWYMFVIIYIYIYVTAFHCTFAQSLDKWRDACLSLQPPTICWPNMHGDYGTSGGSRYSVSISGCCWHYAISHSQSSIYRIAEVSISR